MKVITLIKAKSNVLLWYVQRCSCTRRSKIKILTTRPPPSWIEFEVVTSQRQTQSASNFVMLLESVERFFWLLQDINKRRNVEINNHKPYSRSRVWWCDVTTSNSIQDGGALVVNILVFHLRMQLQHCTYQRKTLLFALIKVSTFICKRQIPGFTSHLTNSSHLSASSRLFWRLENTQSGVVYRTKTVLSILLGLLTIHHFCFPWRIILFRSRRRPAFASYSSRSLLCAGAPTGQARDARVSNTFSTSQNMGS